jgi:tetratricopeptide (TPR) repeat protein
VWAGRATEALPWLESAPRFDHGHLLTANSLCWAYYFFGRYNQAVEAADRALSRAPGRSNQMITHSFLAAAYAETGRSQDAEGERAIIMRLSPFLMHGFSPDNSALRRSANPCWKAQEGRISVNATAFARYR